MHPHRLQRNVRLYLWYSAFFNAFAWMPVFFLFFNKHLPLERVLQLEAIYYAAVVILEAPSGYFSDRVGRKPTLLISAASLAASYVLFLTAAESPQFMLFAIAQILLAVGISFNSGTDTSFHYDSLASLQRETEFGEREAVAARNGLLSAAIAGLLGGAAGFFELRLAYAVSLLAALANLVVVIAFTEPLTHERSAAPGPHFVQQLRICVSYLRRRFLAWLFAFSILMTVLNHVPYEFYQPYIRLTVPTFDLEGDSAPLISGIHMAAAMLLGSVVAASSIRLRDRIGTGRTLLLAALVQTALIGIMGFILSGWVVPLILLRVVPRALMMAPLNAAIAPVVPAAQRATYLSLQSLTGRLCFSATLLLLALLAGGAELADASALSEMLRASFVIGIAGTFLLAMTCRWCLGPEVRESGRE